MKQIKKVYVVTLEEEVKFTTDVLVKEVLNKQWRKHLILFTRVNIPKWIKMIILLQRVMI